MAPIGGRQLWVYTNGSADNNEAKANGAQSVGGLVINSWGVHVVEVRGSFIYDPLSRGAAKRDANCARQLTFGGLS